MRIETFTRKQKVIEHTLGPRSSSRKEVIKNRYYFRLVASNGETIAQSEGYNSKAARNATVKLIRNTDWSAVETVECCAD